MTFKIKIKRIWNILRFYLSFLLLGFYLTIGLLFLFSELWVDLIPSGRGIIGLSLVLFGAIRFYIGYRRYKNKSISIKMLNEKKKNAKVE